MVTCANCPAEAVHEYRVSKDFSVSYCNSCLPKFLYEQKKAGLLKPLPVVVEEVSAPVTKTTKKKTSSVG